MKLVISHRTLLNLIGKIQSVVPTKPALPILNNVLLEAKHDQLILTATDLTLSAQVFGDAEVQAEGAMTIPAKTFFQLVRELRASDVEIHAQTPETAFINSGASHFKLSGMNKSEFPTFPDMNEAVQIEIDAKLLREMLTRCAFAAARDDNRQVLNGILLEHKDGVATFIGTDGKKLARIYTEVKLPEGHTASYVIPLKAVEEIIKLMDTKEAGCKLSLMPDKIGVEIGAATLVMKLLNGQYPDVNRVMPKKADHPLALHREEMMSLLRQISLFAEGQNHAIRCTFAPGELHLSAMHGSVGEGKVSMPVNYSGDKMDVAFNPNFFLEILKHCKDDVVNFSLIDAFNPFLITDSTTASFVLMPMRLEHANS